MACIYCNDDPVASVNCYCRPVDWPRNALGRRFSAWPGAMHVGNVTAEGGIVGARNREAVEQPIYIAGTIAMMRDQAEIAAEHGWEIIEAGVPPENFDVLVRRHV